MTNSTKPDLPMIHSNLVWHHQNLYYHLDESQEKLRKLGGARLRCIRSSDLESDGLWEWIKSKSETDWGHDPAHLKQIIPNKIGDMNPMIVQNKIGDMSSEPIVHSNGNNVGDLECGPDWSGMFPELLVAIAIRLPFMEDFVAFRGVCKPWRSAATKDTFKGSSKLPFLMLAEKDGSSDDRQLFSLSKNTVWTTMSFPWFKNKRCMDVGFGWVVTIAAEGGEVNLVKTFTGATIELPNFKTFEKYHPVSQEYGYIRRGILSADPSLTSDFVLMVLSPTGGLGYWRLGGGTDWKMVDSPRPRFLFGNIGYYKARMFDIDHRGNVRMRDPSAADFTKSDFIVQVHLRNEFLNFMRPYFVESSSGELLLIFRSNVKYLEYGANQFQIHFKVVRIDVVKGKYEIKEGVGKDAIFLGENVVVCVDADNFPGVVKPNCLYYTDDCVDLYSDPNDRAVPGNKGGGRDMGIYNFEDGSIERFAVEESLSYLCPPLWIFPSF